MSIDTAATPRPPLELITFAIGAQDFCMDIMLVREIRGWVEVTPLPHAPVDVLGVMNLRGAVVPIVDLSRRLSLGPCAPHARNVVIIATIGAQVVGLLVTAVSDILAVAPDEMRPIPAAGGAEAARFVSGIVSSRERTLRVLNVDALAATMTAMHEIA